jgi:hypothetical protein
MASLVKHIESILQTEFADFVSGLQTTSTKRVIGFVVSSCFSGKTQEQRQAHLKAVLEDNLEPKQLARIGPIVTMSPAEAVVDEPAE